jgi:hypothetical protein
MNVISWKANFVNYHQTHVPLKILNFKKSNYNLTGTSFLMELYWKVKKRKGGLLYREWPEMRISLNSILCCLLSFIEISSALKVIKSESCDWVSRQECDFKLASSKYLKEKGRKILSPIKNRRASKLHLVGEKTRVRSSQFYFRRAFNLNSLTLNL